jgi:hypothetical protein
MVPSFTAVFREVYATEKISFKFGMFDPPAPAAVAATKD